MSSENIYSITEQQRSNFKPTYLYIKQHKITGLKYFGKTTQKNPYKYNGSGSHWIKHIKKHGKKIETLWVYLFNDIDTLVSVALALSEMYDIVNSDFWSNQMVEDGLSGYNSEQSKSIQNNLIKDGKHYFQSEEHSVRVTKQNFDRVESGIHNFQSDTHKIKVSLSHKNRVENNTHIFQSENHKRIVSESSKIRAIESVKNGTHIFLDPEFRKYCKEITTKNSRNRVKNGTHNFLTNEHKQRVSTKNLEKSKREIYLEVRDLYKLLKLPIPKGLNLKSDKFLYEKKEELLPLIYQDLQP